MIIVLQGALSVNGGRILIDWSYREGLFNALVLSFAMVYFGRNRRGSLLEHAHSEFLDRTVAGIANMW